MAAAPIVTEPSPRSSRMRKPRKPKTENVIATSEHRPFVLANERLRLWSTPYGLSRQQDAALFLSHDTTQLLLDTMVRAIEPDTRKNYGAGLLRFTQFCDCLHISEDARMPATELLVSAFVATWAGKVSKSTIDTWLAGLAFWHALNGATWPADRTLRITCNAALKLEPLKKPKRPPVTLEHMHALRARLDLTDAFDAAVYAVACCAFWGCRRYVRRSCAREGSC